MLIELELESRVRQLFFFDLDDWGAVYATKSGKDFAAYEPSNPGLFRIDRWGEAPIIKRLDDADSLPDEVDGAEIWIFPFDIIAFSIEQSVSGTVSDLKDRSIAIGEIDQLREFAQQQIANEFTGVGQEYLNAGSLQYIQIPQAVKESALDERYREITAILTGQEEEFSDDFVEEMMDSTVPYTVDSYAYVGESKVIQVNSKIDDLFCLWLHQVAFTKKSKRAESYLDDRLQRSYDLLSRPRSFLPLSSFTHRSLQEANPYDKHTVDIVDRFSTSLEAGEPGFYGLANEVIENVLDLKEWKASIKSKYDDLEDSYENLENMYSLKMQEMLEWLIIFFIFISGWLAVIVA